MTDHTDDRRAKLRFQVNELRRQYSNFGFQLEPGDKKLDSGQFVDAIMQLFDTECAERERLAQLQGHQTTATVLQYVIDADTFMDDSKAAARHWKEQTDKLIAALKSGAAGKEAATND